MDFYSRNKYLERLKPYVGKSLIKVIVGQRRVGKSYFLFQVMDYVKKEFANAHIIYINKEDLKFSFIKNAEDLSAYILSEKKESVKNFVFIDEIQDVTNFSEALRSLLLDQDLDLYCTGSNANLLSSDIAGFLSGRYIELKIYSLVYQEFLLFHGLEDSSESLEMYFKYGGLPYLYHLPKQDEVIFDYLKNIYLSILFRDVVNRFQLRNGHFLEQLVLFLSSNIGSLFSSKKISDFLKAQGVKIAPNQVDNYLDYLCSAFLIHKVSRYDVLGKRIFEINEKYYFENLGIRNALWGYRPEDRGKIMENIVYNHLLYLGYEVKIGVLMTQEIDFVAQKNNEVAYFQVALSIDTEDTAKREFGNLIKIKDNYPKTVITLNPFTGNTHKGIKVIDLRAFLKEA
jgi:uncharacterized protein